MPIAWLDLTVKDAEVIRDFYAAVAGLTPEPVSMGEYDDYSMLSDGEAIAGVCHARGQNAGLPPVWLPYFSVVSLETSLAAVTERGGEILAPPRKVGQDMRYAVIRDPSGAAAALIEHTGRT